jgi:chromosome segregation ATPase
MASNASSEKAAPAADALTGAVAGDRLLEIARESSPPVSSAVSVLARFARAEWPEAEELPAILNIAEDLSKLEAESNATLEQAMTQVQQSEAARASASASLEQLVSAVSAPPTSELALLRDRLAALETLVQRAAVKEDRLSQELAAQRRENVDIRARLASSEADRQGLQRRVEKIEYELGHVHKILEIAAQITQAEGAAGGAPT